MASRSSSSTASPRTTMSSSSRRSRSENPGQGRRATDQESRPREGASARGSAGKKHQNLAEVQLRGRQSDQGDRPKASQPRPGSRRSSSPGRK